MTQAKKVLEEMWADVERWPSAAEWPEDTSRVHLVRYADDPEYWSATEDDPAAPLCIPFSHAGYIHPLPEFVVGQVIKGEDYNRLPVGSQVEMLSEMGGSGLNPPWTKHGDRQWTCHTDAAPVDLSIHAEARTITHLPVATEPEDKDDLYVEPEPLKEGDAVLVWAEVQGSEWSDATTPVHLPVPDPDLIFVPAGAIVRPDAGQVAPWIKPAQCTSLYLVVGEDVYIRCHNPEGHVGVHGARFSPGFKQWSGPGDGVTVEGGAS